MSGSARTNHIPEEQVEAARQITLLEYFQRFEPGMLKRVGKSYRTPNGHSSLSISLDGKLWHWFAGQVGGKNALDYLIKVENMPFQEAVSKLTGFVPNVQTREVWKEQSQQQESRPFQLPLKSRYADRAVRYLMGRGIPKDLIQQCLREGTLYESYPHHNVVFVGKDPDGEPKFANLRGTTETHFRIDQEGSDKNYSFRYIPPGCNPDAQRCVAACESPIDALSYVALNRRYHISPINWDKLPVISLSGTAPAALMQYLKDHPRTDTVFLALDNDSGGHKGLKSICQYIKDDPVLSEQVKHIISALPSCAYGKDYNEMLQALSPCQQTRSMPGREGTICHCGTKSR